MAGVSHLGHPLELARYLEVVQVALRYRTEEHVHIIVRGGCSNEVAAVLSDYIHMYMHYSVCSY